MYTVKIGIEALNEVLDEGLELHPLQEQRDSVRDWRQIGLGIMGIADMLIKLGITYGSSESIKLCDDIAFSMIDTSLFVSSLLARDEGVFLKCNKEEILQTPFAIENTSDATKQSIQQYGLRNSQILTIAPTGTISTMLGISGGIEPIFANSYTRKTESLHGTDTYYKVYTPIVQKYMDKNNINEEDDLPEFFITSSNLNYKNRIDMQAIWQKRIDASISSTVNLPNESTAEEVSELYQYAWERGLKGVTIYRDGCKRGGILTTSDNQNETLDESLNRGEWKPKAEDTVYHQKKIHIGCGKLSLFIGWSDSEKCIQDLYVQRTGKGGCEKNIQSTVISMSGMIRLGGNLSNIEKAFDGLGACNSFVSNRSKGEKLSKGVSCGTAILNAIKEFMAEMNVDPKNNLVKVKTKTVTQKELKLTDDDIEYIKRNGEIDFAKKTSKCPACAEKLSHIGGCIQCESCGWSKCD